MISSKQLTLICLLIAAFTTYSVNAQPAPERKPAITLKEAFAHKFHMGTALNMAQLRTPPPSGDRRRQRTLQFHRR